MPSSFVGVPPIGMYILYLCIYMKDSVLYHYAHMHIHMYNKCMHTHSDMHIRDMYTCTCMSCQVKCTFHVNIV